MRGCYLGTCGWLNDWGAPCFCLFLLVMRRGTRRAGSPVGVCWWAGTLWWLLMSGERPEPLGWELAGCGVCPDGVSSGPCLSPSSTDQLPSHNGTDQQQTLHLKSHQMKMRGVWYIKSMPDCQASQREIHHWHLEFVWWPEMERLDFRCLMLNCTVGVQQTWEGKQNINWWISIDK